MKRNWLWVRSVLFYIVALTIACLLAGTGFLVFTAGGKPKADYLVKGGEVLLQLAVIVVAGGLAKALIDWGVALRTRESERNEQRLDLLRRVRAVHVAVLNARDLLNAHKSAKTWAEQMRRLIALRPEVEEISEDVLASRELFRQKDDIRAGLEGIVHFLERGGKEYVARHNDVDADYKQTPNDYSLSKTITEKKMVWVDGLMNANRDYSEGYVNNLVKAKGGMRSETFGAS